MLEALARHRAMSLADIHRETGLPKSTLRRLLATLVGRRFARKSMTDGLYRVTVTLPDISAEPVPPRLALLADLGLLHILKLTEKIGWPSDVHAIEDQWMRIVETSRAASPYSFYRVQPDRRVSLFASATGSACLSTLTDQNLLRLFDNHNAAERFKPARFGITWTELKSHLIQIRLDGFATRYFNYTGETVPNDKLCAIALPLRRDGKAIGAVNILWPKSLMSPPEFAAIHLKDLQTTVADIEAYMAAF